MEDPESRARDSPIPRGAEGVQQLKWVTRLLRAVLTGGGLGLLMLALAWAPAVAVAVDGYIVLGMLRQALTAAPTHHRVRRAMRWGWNDPEQSGGAEAALTELQRRERHRLQRLATGTALLASAAALTALMLPRPWLILSSIAAAWFLVVSTKIPRLRERAGLPALSQHGHVLRDLADSLHIPHAWYASGVAVVVAPLTLALGVVGMTAGTAGALLDVQDRQVRVGGITVEIEGQSAPEAARRGPSASPSDRPYCAEYRTIGWDLRQGASPEEVATDLEAAWRRINWPTLGCVAAPPQRLGRGWYVQLQGPRGDGLLVHLGGRAHVVHDRFTAHVLAVAPELRFLSERIDFGAGQYHLIELADGCHALMSTPERGALLLPAGSTLLAARLGDELTAFPWITDLQPNQVYSVSLLMPADAYPGYLAASTAQLPKLARPSLMPKDAVAGDDCSAVGLTLQRLAAPLYASSQRHESPGR